MFYCFSLRGLRKIGTYFLFLVAVVLGIRFFALPNLFCREHKNLVEKYAKENGLEESLVYAVMFVESRFDENAVSSKGARGLMQISAITGKWGADVLNIENFTEESLFDAETNIKIGCWYLSVLFKQYGNNQDTVIAAYNAGSGNVSKWLGDENYSSDGINLYEIPFGETEKYVRKVNIVKKIYEFIY
ncbi:MAG: lytic transglycosylase domain-containing protein [Lachnospiraceae bacterium]|nr:lytic transglycosylase domain-containing protein [Lachnospiraceae bacterium]